MERASFGISVLLSVRSFLCRILPFLVVVSRCDTTVKLNKGTWNGLINYSSWETLPSGSSFHTHSSKVILSIQTALDVNHSDLGKWPVTSEVSTKRQMSSYNTLSRKGNSYKALKFWLVHIFATISHAEEKNAHSQELNIAQ